MEHRFQEEVVAVVPRSVEPDHGDIGVRGGAHAGARPERILTLLCRQTLGVTWSRTVGAETEASWCSTVTEAACAR